MDANIKNHVAFNGSSKQDFLFLLQRLRFAATSHHFVHYGLCESVISTDFRVSCREVYYL
jgi:hypothetical protein